MDLRPVLSLAAVLVGALIYLFAGESAAKAGALVAVGALLVFTSGEDVALGFKRLGARLGLSSYLSGSISSFASNLPELAVSVLLVANPALRELAVLMVILAAAFNLLLLSVVILVLARRGGYVEVPREAVEGEVEAIRLTITYSFLLACLGILLNVFGAEPYVPREVMLVPLASFAGYFYFMVRGSQQAEGGEKEAEHREERGEGWVLPLLVGFVSLAAGAEYISHAAEFFTEAMHLNIVLTAMAVAFAGSIPEHSIALVSARRGEVEMGISNVVGGVVQSLMVVLPLVGLVAPIPLDGYIVFQLMVTSASLWLLEKAVMDDSRFTVDEGLFILLAQLMGLLLLDELSFMI